MLFNSFQFALFFPIVTALYFLVPFRWKVPFLLAASCVFYMVFIPKYILILFTTITVDYAAGRWLSRTVDEKLRKLILVASLLVTLSILFVFKYYNFFEHSFHQATQLLGMPHQERLLQFVLPIGLSFHTFQSMSYVIEVYRRRQEPERNFLLYSLFVMFYPQLVAGPIERPQNLLHQFRIDHRFEYARVVNGLKLMTWGLVMKMVIADRLAILVNKVHEEPGTFTGLPLILSSLFFSIQIYCDFAGYSNLAIGSAQVMGFDLMTNFDRPYFAKSITEFWRRWHISLSTWFRDYVYVPLGGNRMGTGRMSFNILLTFTLSGLWHGANLTFVIWGALNGLIIVVERCFRSEGDPRKGALRNGFKIGTTFLLITVTWIFFRADSVTTAVHILKNLPRGLCTDIHRLFLGGFDVLRDKTVMGYDLGLGSLDFLIAVLLILFLGLIESRQNPIQLRQLFSQRPFIIRWCLYTTLLAALIFLTFGKSDQFIYFQF